jgi:uncharacterized RDD family membrane protein YckC
MNWYYVNATGQQAGPLDEAALDNLFASGRINAETLIWKEGMANWQPFREMRPIGAAVAPASGGEAVCAECGGIFPINDTIQIGNARVCANCKPVFVQKMQEGLNVQTAGNYQYAGFWIRFAAAFVDGLILSVFKVCLNMLVLGTSGFMASSMTRRNGGAALFSASYVFVMLAQIAVALSYETFFIGKYGATLGKMACKIKVIVADGSPVGYGRALGRYLSKIVSSLTCLIGYIMAGFDDEKRALHDRMCDTRVVYK